MKIANHNVPVMPPVGSLEWRWIQAQIAESDREWMEHEVELDRERERELALAAALDGDDHPWYSGGDDSVIEIVEPEIFDHHFRDV